MAQFYGFETPGFMSRGLATTPLLQELLLKLPVLDYSLTWNVGEAKKARAWQGCKRQVVSIAPGEEEIQLTLSIQAVNWSVMQFAYGELAANVDVNLPISTIATVPTTAPHEITDPAIAAALSSASVRLYLCEGIGAELADYLLVTAAAPATAREVQVDIAGGRLVFHPDLAGATIAYTVEKDLISVPSIGKTPDPVKFGDMQFYGYACNEEWENHMMIHCPLVKRSGKPSISTADDIPTLEISFEVLVPAGEREAVHFYRLPA